MIGSPPHPPTPSPPSRWGRGASAPRRSRQPTSPALAAHGLSLRHPGAERDAVRDLHLAIAPGEAVALVGANGSGKSTLLRGLGRALSPRRGRVEVGGADAWSLSCREFARRVARLPQEPVCPEGLTVEELVTAGRYARRGPWRAPATGDRRAVAEALDRLELGDLRRRALETLSGGERRRAWLAMVLAQEAGVLLLDEPTAGLDLRHQVDLLDRLAELRRGGTTLVVVLHDLAHAARVGDRLAVMVRGRLYDCAPPAEVLAGDALRDAFGIDAEVAAGPAGWRLDDPRAALPVRSL